MACDSICLLLLTCLAGFTASEREQGIAAAGKPAPYGPSSVVISGVNTVTVGVPYGFQCSASCFPACKYTWTRDNLTSQGPELRLLLKERRPPQVLTCVAVNPDTGKSVSIHKTLQVTVGPSNVQISGPPMLSVGRESTFYCSADCYPSCDYTWTLLWSGETLRTTHGNKTTIKPPATIYSETLICEAQDSVSRLYITVSLSLMVARLFDIYITGPSTVTMGQKYVFTCYATCTPSCNYIWKFDRKTSYGDQTVIPIFHNGRKTMVMSKKEFIISEYKRHEPLTCEVQNTISKEIINATRILNILDPISVQPVSQAKPMAGQPFSLQCVGSQNPASITWMKNGLPVPLAERVHLSSDNVTLTFSPLTESDTGLYQCAVSQGGISIKSLGHQLTINYGPLQVVIVQPNKGPVGKVMYALPGSATTLDCVANCNPNCSYMWFYNDRLLATYASILFTPKAPPYQALLICMALNPATEKNSQAETTVIIPEGPASVTISGPDSLEIGVMTPLRCLARCTPSCTYTWNLHGETLAGSVINITAKQNMNSLSVSCEARNTVSGMTARVAKTLPVSDPISVRPVSQAKPVAGQPFSLQCVGSRNPASITWMKNGLPVPLAERVHLSSNNITLTFSPLTESDTGLYQCVVSQGGVSIKSLGHQLTVNYGPLQVVIVQPNKGPVGKVMYALPGSATTLDCAANCYPNCSYMWFYNGRLLAKNASILFTPKGPPYQAPLICTASNPVTEKNSSAEATVIIPEGPASVTISGPDSLEIGVMTPLRCLARCTPSCTYTWKLHGETLTGSVINITAKQNMNSLSVSCEARNTVSGMTARVAKTFPVSDPISVRPVSQAKPVAGQPFSLQCVGSQNPASITWMKNSLPVPLAERVHLSSNNITLTFSPLTESDAGLYQCVVSQGGVSIKSLGHQLTVNYGPLQVVIVQPNKGPVGKVMYALPGSATTLDCVANCYPNCSYMWFYNGRLLAKNASILFTPKGPPYQAPLICTASNSVTEKNSSAETTVIVPEGPASVTISGPDSLEIGVMTPLRCLARCTPSCTYTWNLHGETLAGRVINITAKQNMNSLSVSCEARNTVSGMTARVVKTLPVSDPISVRPVSQAKPVAGQPFSLQCVGSHNPASITWMKNGLPVPLAERVHLSSNNVTLTFSPLTESDTGLYQCVVSQGGVSIKSLGHQLTVNYGPLQVVIVQPNKGPIGKVMYALPGSATTLDCAANCYPNCSYMWFYNGRLLAKNASILFTPKGPPYQAPLICTASNSVTEKNSSAEATVIIPDGPANVAIVGPDSLEVGVRTTFVCLATCIPSCNYTWRVYGKTMTGSKIDITLNRQVTSESISCEAQNTVSGRMATVNETITVTEPQWCGC